VLFFGSHALLSPLDVRMVRTRHVSAHAVHAGHALPGIFMASCAAAQTTHTHTHTETPRLYDEDCVIEIVSIANWNTLVPPTPNTNTTSPEIFEAFSDPAFDGQYVSFLGLGSFGTLGVYKVSIHDMVIRLVADTNSDVPGTNTRFEDFPEIPSIASGTLTFVANAAELSGIYTHQCASHTITPVITLSDTLLGEPAVYLGFGTNAFNGHSLSFYAVLRETGFLGIYSASPKST